MVLITILQLTVLVVLQTVQFNLETALQTNDVMESDVKEVIKKQLDNTHKCKDDEKTQITQIKGLINQS